MKKFVITAAALTLGTSAFAWAPAEMAHLGGAKLQPAADTTWSGGKSPLSFESFDDKGATTMKTAGADMPEGMKTLAEASDGETKLQTAAVDSSSFAKFEDASLKTASADTAALDWSAKAKSDADIQTANWDGKDKPDTDVQTASFEGKNKSGAEIQTAALDDKPELGAEVQTASWDGKTASDPAGKETGMGGPLEEAQGYPPCDPGPGNDRCIQLYEPGVRTALAAWKGSDGNVAMGGPFEPAEAGSTTDTAGKGKPDQSPAASAAPMNHGSGHADHGTTAGMPAEPDVATAKPNGTDASTDTTPGAVGGPVEASDGYPPCRPGRGDDRCIQLYERGVTGRSN